MSVLKVKLFSLPGDQEGGFAAKNYERKMLMPGYFLRALFVVFLRVLCGLSS